MNRRSDAPAELPPLHGRDDGVSAGVPCNCGRAARGERLPRAPQVSWDEAGLGDHDAPVTGCVCIPRNSAPDLTRVCDVRSYVLEWDVVSSGAADGGAAGARYGTLLLLVRCVVVQQRSLVQDILTVARRARPL